MSSKNYAGEQNPSFFNANADALCANAGAVVSLPPNL
jgi:hypothetical protein